MKVFITTDKNGRIIDLVDGDVAAKPMGSILLTHEQHVQVMQSPIGHALFIYRDGELIISQELIDQLSENLQVMVNEYLGAE